MAEASFLSVEADIREPIAFLRELGGKEKTVMRHILSGVGTSAKNEAKRAYRPSGFSKRSGELYKSITKKVLRSGKGVLVEAKARNKNNVFYGYALSKGSLIKAKDEKLLTFQIDGKWIRKHEVKLTETNFIVAPVEKYLTSKEFRERLDVLVEREVKKIEKRKAQNGN